MEAGGGQPRIIVGVDGSGASLQALRTARALAGPLGAAVEAWACWDVPAGFGIYLAVGIEGFEFAAKQALQQALTDAFGATVPPEIRGRLLRGSAAHLLIEGSREAALLIVGRHGHAGFVPGPVSSACVSHAHCPVLVVPARAAASDGGR
ncbi:MULTISPECIES: universal stress protein [unclassified Pseudarthrobacter]|uniref:universal stress protein n=1 Tax=unclassified Pseudarthrobacter TaxID=2647000 RepID=UPI0036278091